MTRSFFERIHQFRDDAVSYKCYNLFMNNFCQVWLTCADQDEASRIAQVLLDKKLIACAKYLLVNSDFRFEGKLENSSEILIVMETHERLFDQIEAEVEKLHSYDTFVLQAIPLTKISQKVATWLQESTRI